MCRSIFSDLIILTTFFGGKMSDLYNPQNEASATIESIAEAKKPLLQGALISKNVRIHDRRTSVRLEPEMWDALHEIALLEDCSIHDLCGAVHELKDEGASFTAALRVFLMEYYRTAAKTSQQVGQIQRHLKAGRCSGRLSTLAADLSHKISA
jgi:predicted DNA-binding ribbon-helix-helix protein